MEMDRGYTENDGELITRPEQPQMKTEGKWRRTAEKEWEQLGFMQVQG